MFRTLSNKQGNLFIVAAVALTAVIGVTLVSSNFSASQQRRAQLSNLQAVESFGSAEIAAWNGYYRVKAGRTLASTGSPVSVTNQYDTGLTISPTAYNGAGYTAGTRLNVATTKEYDSARTLIRNYKDNDLQASDRAISGSICGSTAQKSRGNFSVCLAQDTKCSPTLCDGVVTCPAALEAQPLIPIRTQSDLATMTSSNRYRLMNDITLTGTWTPINATTQNIIIDGNGKTIKNLKVNTPKPGGLFETLGGNVVVTNLTFEDVDITNTSNLGGAGALAGNMGYDWGRSPSVAGEICIDNVTVRRGTITGMMGAGGVSSAFESTKTYVKNVTIDTLTINANIFKSAGGLFGTFWGAAGGKIKDCRVINTTITSGGAVGGLVGSLDVPVSNYVTPPFEVKGNTTSGTIHVERGSGGLIGGLGVNVSDYVTDPVLLLKMSQNSSSVNVDGGTIGTNLGGLVGIISISDTVQVAEYIQIDHSMASGAVSGKDYLGGLIGMVSATNMVGSGTVGLFKITKSVATGNVTANPVGPMWNSVAGGLVGYMKNTTVTDSYSTGAVTAGKSSGAFIGSCDTGRLQSNYTTGRFTPTGPGVTSTYVAPIPPNPNPATAVGGLLGANSLSYSCTDTNSFWDTDATQITHSRLGTGLTTSQMKTTPSFAAWDSTIWNITSGNYPTLK